MPIELRILTGSRGGYRERFAKRTIALGRHAGADLRFDPNGDLDVSVRHAQIVEQAGGEYRVRDLGSTNGTFLNGHRVGREETLRDGDVLWLGTDGPRVEVHLVSPNDEGAREEIVRRPSTEERVKAGVRRELRRILVAVIVLAVVAAGVVYWAGHRGSTMEPARPSSNK